jgi:TM2 domain-containing membrane protein YozV
MAKDTQPIPAASRGSAIVIAGVLAWLLPGAGHFYLGRRLRGVILCLTVLATFLIGMVVGGVMTVDRQYERYWFYAQAMTGLPGLAGWRASEAEYDSLREDEEIRDLLLRQAAIVRGTTADQPAKPPFDPGVNVYSIPTVNQGEFDRISKTLPMLVDQRLREKGIALVPPQEGPARAYTGVAGMLNLLCVFDAVMLALLGTRGESAKPSPSRPADAEDSAETPDEGGRA